MDLALEEVGYDDQLEELLGVELHKGDGCAPQAGGSEISSSVRCLAICYF